MSTPYTEIFVPGRGFVNFKADAVNKAVMGYDERLRFGWNPENQDWIVYIRMPRDFDSYYRIDGDPVYPVIGFGKEIPEPHEALMRAMAADGMRLGMRILNQMNKENAQIESAQNAIAQATIEETAERIEHHIRKSGDTEKYTKIFPAVTAKEKRG